jgi:hypothetical protein
MSAPSSTIGEPRGETRATRKTEAEATGRFLFLPSLFVYACAIPFIIDIGELRLSPNRILLLLVLFPAMIAWLVGVAGKKRWADFYLLAFTAWCTLSMAVVDGFSTVFQGIGMWIIETCGAYFLGRVFVRNTHQFMAVVKSFRLLIYILVPFALLEAFSRQAVLINILSKVGKTIESIYGEAEFRLGLRRAQVSFEHPILFGVFASYGAGLFVYAFEKKTVRFVSGFRAIPSAVATFCSLSTGAYLSVVIQLMFAAWDYLTRALKNRWWVLFGIFLFFYITIDALSNRSPFEVFITYAVFDSGSSYNRVLIWQYGTAQVAKAPLLGVGLNGDWERPWWMVSSMDNFFLLLAVRYGIPASVFMMLCVFLNLKSTVQAPLKSQKLRNLRLGYIIMMIGVIVASVTVHFWTATYVFFLFWVGAGAWFSDVAINEDHDDQTVAKPVSELEAQPKKQLNFRPAVKPGRPVQDKPVNVTRVATSARKKV